MRTNWIFVDHRVADRPSLLAGLDAHGPWRLIGADEDGLRQIRQALAGQGEAASIRIVAHGRPGAIRLGAGEVDAGTLAARAALARPARHEHRAAAARLSPPQPWRVAQRQSATVRLDGSIDITQIFATSELAAQDFFVTGVLVRAGSACGHCAGHP